MKRILSAMQKFAAPIPLSLYIHIPWCVRKCPYCDFNSHKAGPTIPEELYTEALLADLNEQLSRIAGRQLVSIFFGGGTPSLFSPEAIEKILLGVKASLEWSAAIEITLEANPGTIDEARFKGFRQAGVNRLSIGIQSLQNDKLQALGRIHDREYALRAIESAKTAGFDNFNVDLMHGLPQQTVADALQDLSDALDFAPPHLSWYQLTIEPHTLFHHRPPVLPEEELLWNIQATGHQLLAQAGLHQYEVSAYARKECVHNRNYWEFGDYLGIGAGAHSKITDIERGLITRHSQVNNPRDYLDPQKKFTFTEKILTEKELVFEFMMNALRLVKGVPRALFSARTGLDPVILEPILQQAYEKKLLLDDPAVYATTEQGFRFLNDVIRLFLS